MRIGEVCLQTNDVIQLADFYRCPLGINDDNKDSVHQTIIAPDDFYYDHYDAENYYNECHK